MSYSEQATAFAHDGLAERILQSVFSACLDISGEDPSSFATEEWASKRQALAQVFLSNHAQRLLSMRRAVIADMDDRSVDLSDPSNETNITDAMIDTSVSAVWDDQAGVTYADSHPA